MVLSAGSTLGPFRIIELLGRGGMACVYKAYEADLDRYVALKVLPAEFLHDPTFAQRFEREARIVAKLEHPNIIPIYRYGIDGGTPWMSMRLLQAGSLSQTLRRGTLERPRAIEILRQVAAALECAHRQGVTHRDVKPSNVLLDEDGRPYVADFGIAKLAEANIALSRTGVVAGTPRYMAPEQGCGDPVDHRADIYALGIMAYELLTGAVPFDADTPFAIVYKHAHEPLPIPPSDQVPEPIMRPVLKALAKNPDERWDSAVAFTTALASGALIADSPNLADGPTLTLPVAPARRATATRPGAAADQVTAPLARTPEAEDRQSAPTRPPRSIPRTRRAWALGTALLVVVVIVLAVPAWQSVESEMPPAVSGPFEPPPPVELVGHTGPVVAAAFSPDGTRVATASKDDTARVWAADGAGAAVVLSGHTASVRTVAFSPDGTRVVTASDDGTARVWSADGTGEPVVLAGHLGAVVSAEFSPNGALVVTASTDGRVRVWSAEGTGRPVELAGHTASVRGASFSLDGSRVLSASTDGTARVWKTDGSGTPVVLKAGSSVNMAAFSPDGARVVTAEVGYPAARIWPADGAGEPVVLAGHTGSVLDATFSPDGTRVATASIDNLARVWRVDGTGEPVALAGHTDRVVSVAFSPDGTRLVTASWDCTVRIWQADGSGEPVVLTGHTDSLVSAAFSPDGTRVITSSDDDTARIWWFTVTRPRGPRTP